MLGSSVKTGAVEGIHGMVVNVRDKLSIMWDLFPTQVGGLRFYSNQIHTSKLETESKGMVCVSDEQVIWVKIG